MLKLNDLQRKGQALGEIDRLERIAQVLFRRIRTLGYMESGPRGWKRGESLVEMKTNYLGGRLPRVVAPVQKCDLINGV